MDGKQEHGEHSESVHGHGQHPDHPHYLGLPPHYALGVAPHLVGGHHHQRTVVVALRIPREHVQQVVAPAVMEIRSVPGLMDILGAAPLVIFHRSMDETNLDMEVLTNISI
jgi:hypothetical protein